MAASGFISDKHKCIFIHIPRTGGTSTGTSIIEKIDKVQIIGHKFCKIIIDKLDKKKFNSYYKFTIIRNPYDRAVSWYAAHIRKDPVSFENFIYMFEGNIGMHQHSYFMSDNKIIVDKIYKFENLHESFKDICNKLNLDIELKHINKTNHKHYREVFNNKTKDLFEKICKKDLELLNYKY